MWCLFLFKQKTAYEMRISDWSSDVCSSDLHVDRNDLLRDDVVEDIRAALEDRGVLVFPQIDLSDDQQREFTDRLGGTRQKSKMKVPGFDSGAEDIYKIGRASCRVR